MPCNYCNTMKKRCRITKEGLRKWKRTEVKEKKGKGKGNGKQWEMETEEETETETKRRVTRSMTEQKKVTENTEWRKKAEVMWEKMEKWEKQREEWENRVQRKLGVLERKMDELSDLVWLCTQGSEMETEMGMEEEEMGVMGDTDMVMEGDRVTETEKMMEEVTGMITGMGSTEKRMGDVEMEMEI
jgi:hypothetical protein